MSVRVLQDYAENEAAREELRRRGISYWPAPAGPAWRRLLGRTAPVVGELNKSWDVLNTVALLGERLAHDDPVLDMGAYASEVLCSLHLLGFRRLSGIDLNPRVKAMPFRRQVAYHVGDMTRTPFPDAAMAAITSISAVEHGVDASLLFAEAARLLRPGGLFVASTDYWPDKIDTAGVLMYGVPWKVFSRGELQELLAAAQAHGLEPLGECRFEAREPAIECAGRRYTFAWMALVRR